MLKGFVALNQALANLGMALTAAAPKPKPGHAWKDFMASLDHPNSLGHK